MRIENNMILNKLPDVKECKNKLKQLAAFDAVFSPEWENRYYSYDSLWYEGEEMASMRNGRGEHYFILFTDEKILMKGLERQSKCLSMKDFGKDMNLPEILYQFMEQVAFLPDETSFCIWKFGQGAWNSITKITENELKILGVLLISPEQYVQWVEDYYEITLSVEEVAALFQENVLHKKTCLQWNPHLDWDAFQKEAKEIGMIVRE
ncbi:MAG: hypothetical protein HGA25_07355 [Clostridiales bacterium]|nr:hypothetical protein [Clostridiales bacterium]